MYGLRNPWRFSFDRATGDVWIGDVGQNAYEEIDFAAAGTGAGINWGWSAREGYHEYQRARRRPARATRSSRLTHSDGNCAIIGGYVYRGTRDSRAARRVRLRRQLPQRAHRRRRNATASASRPGATSASHVEQLTSFGEDADGELYVLSRARDTSTASTAALRPYGALRRIDALDDAGA